MTDQHVDELLADLDRALAVEPSPSVAAQVRSSIAAQPEVGWFGLHWQFVITAVGVVAIVVGAGFVVWLRSAGLPAPLQMVASETAEAPAPTVAVPLAVTGSPIVATADPRERVAQARRTAPVRTVAAAVEREPEVLISTRLRLGLAQLAEAARRGRLNSDLTPAGDDIALPDPIVIPSVVISPLKLDLVPGGGGGETVR